MKRNDVTYHFLNSFSYRDYSPFGSLMPGRHGNEDTYNRGFNGMLKDDEIKNVEGSSYDFGARMYDSRVGSWLSRDAHEATYPSISAYTYVGNSPLQFIDPDGKDIIIAYEWMYKDQPKIVQLKYSNGKFYSMDGKEWNGKGIGKTYFKAVKEDLNKLKSLDKETKKVVEYLEGNKTEVHYISNRENLVAGKGADEEYDGKEIRNKNRPTTTDDKTEKLGTWTTYNAFNWKEEFSDLQGADNDKNDKLRDPICALGHELFHAYQRSLKLIDHFTAYEIDGNYIKKSEIDAVNFENIIRSKIKETKRTKYAGTTIPSQLLK